MTKGNLVAFAGGVTNIFVPVRQNGPQMIQRFWTPEHLSLDKMLNTLADQCTLQVNRETTGWCQHHKLQNSIQGNIYNQGFSSVSSNNQRIA